MCAHVHEPPPRRRRSAPGVPPEFDAVIARAMAKDPDDRYPSAGDLGARRAGGRRARRRPADRERSVATGDAAAPRRGPDVRGPCPLTAPAPVASPDECASPGPATAPGPLPAAATAPARLVPERKASAAG